MKKAMSLAMILVLIVLLAVPAAAAEGSATLRVVTEDVPSAPGIQRITTTAADNEEVVVGSIAETVSEDYVDKNTDFAKELLDAAGGKTLEVLDSFHIKYLKDGEARHSGITVTVEVEIPEKYVGQYLSAIYSVDNDGETSPENCQTGVAWSGKINSKKVVLPLTQFCTYTLVVTDKPLKAVSPQTGDRFITAAIGCVAVLALGAAVYAGKRKNSAVQG